MADAPGSHRGGRRRRRGPPLYVLVASSALLVWSVRFALVGLAGLAGWDHVLWDFGFQLEGPWHAMLDHFVTPTGAALLRALGGGLGLLGLVGLWTRRRWGRRIASLLCLTVLAGHVLDLTSFSEVSLAWILSALLGAVLALAVLALLHDTTVDAWLAERERR